MHLLGHTGLVYEYRSVHIGCLLTILDPVCGWASAKSNVRTAVSQTKCDPMIDSQVEYAIK